MSERRLLCVCGNDLGPAGDKELQRYHCVCDVPGEDGYDPDDDRIDRRTRAHTYNIDRL